MWVNLGMGDVAAAGRKISPTANIFAVARPVKPERPGILYRVPEAAAVCRTTTRRTSFIRAGAPAPDRRIARRAGT
jgi:hypothetical protein